MYSVSIDMMHGACNLRIYVARTSRPENAPEKFRKFGRRLILAVVERRINVAHAF